MAFLPKCSKSKLPEAKCSHIVNSPWNGTNIYPPSLFCGDGSKALIVDRAILIPVLTVIEHSLVVAWRSIASRQAGWLGVILDNHRAGASAAQSSLNGDVVPGSGITPRVQRHPLRDPGVLAAMVATWNSVFQTFQGITKGCQIRRRLVLGSGIWSLRSPATSGILALLPVSSVLQYRPPKYI